MEKVLVVGAYIMGLGVIRALHLKNIDVVAIHYDKTDIAHLSRYVAEKARIPHPADAEAEFVEFLVRNSDRWRGAMIVATDDHSAVSIAKNKDTLSQYYVVASPDWEAVQTFIEKEKTYQLAQECGVPYPTTFCCEDLRELDGVKQDLTYPCILKPIKGHEFKSKFHTKNFKVQNATELVERFTLCQEMNQSVMIQEIIPGSDMNIQKMQGYVNSKGKLVGKFFLGKLRSNPPPFGVGRVVVSRKRIPEVEDYADRLLTAAGFKGGFFSIEFKKDPRDNQLKLMENNIRLVRINWLSTSCGINFPWLMYMDLVHDQQLDVEDYKEGFYWIELYSDILNSVFRHSREDIRFREYVQPYLTRNKTFAVFSLRDPLPFLKYSLNLPRLLFRSTTRKA